MNDCEIELPERPPENSYVGEGEVSPLDIDASSYQILKLGYSTVLLF